MQCSCTSILLRYSSCYGVRLPGPVLVQDLAGVELGVGRVGPGELVPSLNMEQEHISHRAEAVMENKIFKRIICKRERETKNNE